MSVSIPVFWSVLHESRLLAPEQVQQLSADFGHVKGASEQGNAKALGEWLVARNVLSKYQATILLAGRSGPFYYGDYKVYDRVEKGRLAGQFRAVHAPTGHPVLLQFLTGPVISDPQLWATAANEARTAGSIVSPHVQRCFEPVDLQSFKFLVSEDLRGDSLEQRLTIGRFPAHEAARIIRLAAIGLAHMHQCGRVHGDVRPANILLESIPNHPGNAKLLFEAHQTPGPIDFSQQQEGSPLSLMADYLAPELMSPGRAADSLADIYALGCSLYAMLAGSPPFAGGDIQQKMTRHASEAIRPLESYGVPQPLSQLATYMMAKNPAVRYQSAAIVAEQIAAFVDPNALYVQPPPAPATLAGYEHLVRQKQAALAPAQVPQQATGFPGIVTTSRPLPQFSLGPDSLAPGPAATRPDAGFPGLAIQVGGKSAAPSPVQPSIAAIGQPASPAAAPVVVMGGPAKGGKGSGADLVRRHKQQQQQMIIGGSVGAGVLVIALVVGLILLNAYNNEPGENEIAANIPEQIDPETPPDSTPGNPASGTPATVTNTASGNTGNPATPVPPATGGNTGTANPPTTSPPTSTPGSGNTTPTPTVPPGEAGLAQEILPDDGNLLWASPTTGKPISFRCVPPEAQVFLVIRPMEMIASGEGEKVLQALGPTFSAQREAWEAASGFKLGEIEQLTIGLHNNDAKFPRTSFVVKTKEAQTPEQLLAKWSNPMAVQEEKGTYYTGATWAYYVGTAPDDERTFLMGEARDVKDVAKVAGGPPVLFREMERLRRTTDASRHVTLLFYPQFLFNDDGEPLFAAERTKVRQPLAWLLGDHLQASAISLHFGEELYFEMRMLGSLDKEPYKLAAELKDRLNQVPTSLEDYVALLTPPVYWRKLANRYPGMIRDLHSNLRTGVESEQAVVNSVLPGAAAHNLALGGELLVATAPGAAVVAATAPAAKAPQTIEEALQLKTTYNFAQQSLEFAMRDLAVDVRDLAKGAPFEFDIKIIGKDLEVGGITRNQSVREFDQQDKTVAEILTALCMKANPITTVKDPSEVDQKLIWVIGPDPDNAAKTMILITTRTAADAKKYTLPPQFVPKKA